MSLRRPLLAAVLLAGINLPALASDHDDTPTLKALPRHDARLTDLHVFTHHDHLVIGLASNPALPAPPTPPTSFASDLIFRIHVDRHSAVGFSDPVDLAKFGGTILDPAGVRPDLTFEFTFDKKGKVHLRQLGKKKIPGGKLEAFAGLRDDPFIRGPRIGRNIMALVLQMPLERVLAGTDSTILVWATASFANEPDVLVEHAGRSLRSQLMPELALNELTPAEHFTVLGKRPDVILYDTSLPAGFPNGRALEDDVVDLVGIPGVLMTDAPFPAANDVPFLADFPYLAPPQ